MGRGAIGWLGVGVCAVAVACSADEAGPTCGDGTCNWWENASNCPADCPTTCGDGRCDGDETAVTCPADCAVCGDGTCSGDETPATCPADCGTCGNGVCDPGETDVSCTADCFCGNGTCDQGEDSSTCSERSDEANGLDAPAGGRGEVYHVPGARDELDVPS